jgi:hypothetical protein
VEWLRTELGLQYIRFLYSTWAWGAYASSAERAFRGEMDWEVSLASHVTKLPTCGLVRNVLLDILTSQQQNQDTVLH